MILNAEQEAEALELLHQAGIEGDDATTSLATLCKLSTQTTLHGWVRAHVGNTPDTLAAQYGHDAARAAYVLTRHPIR